MLYIADYWNENIRKVPLDQPDSMSSVVASLKFLPTSIYVDDDNDGPIIYVSLDIEKYSVEKWIYGSSSSVQVGTDCSYCKGISVDKEKNVYMVEIVNSRVVKWSPKTNTTTTIDVNDGKCEMTDPCFTFLYDTHINQIDNSLYVVDRNNHQIQKWSNDGKIRITVAGSSVGEKGNDAASLYYPNGLFVDDETETVYVADTYNHRVQRWLVNAFEGETIAGGYGDGNSAHQLERPNALDFDDEGNLYVCDNVNRRIQKFNIIDNRPCPATSKRTTSSAPTTITTMPTIGKSSTSTTRVLTTVTKHSLSTTAFNNHAVYSYWNCSYGSARTITAQLIIVWIIAILF